MKRRSILKGILGLVGAGAVRAEIGAGSGDAPALKPSDLKPVFMDSFDGKPLFASTIRDKPCPMGADRSKRVLVSRDELAQGALDDLLRIQGEVYGKMCDEAFTKLVNDTLKS